MAFLPRLAQCSTPRLSRSLFSLPDLSSFSPFSGGPSDGSDGVQRYHERKIFPYSRSQLYNVVADASAYPRFLPFCTGARVMDRTSPSPGLETMDVEMTVGFLSFSETYVSKVTCKVNHSVEAVAASSTPLFKALDTVWRFQPASARSPHPTADLPPPASSSSGDPTAAADTADGPDNGPTLVSLDLAFAFANPVHAAVSATFFGQVSKMMVQAFEERCIDLYGHGKS